MGKYNAHVSRFNVGEYSPSALTRVDLEDVRLAAEIQENILPHAVGKGQFRPGTTFLGRTYRDRRARLAEFNRGPNDSALLEMTEEYLRIWSNDELVSRDDVDCTIFNGDFNIDTAAIPTYDGTVYDESGQGWDVRGGVGVMSGNGRLQFNGQSRGATSTATYRGFTNSPGLEHGILFDIGRGPLAIKIGSVEGGDDLFPEQIFETGRYSLSVVPTGSIHITITYRESDRTAFVDLVEIEPEGPVTLAAPWLEGDLPFFQFEQSSDTIFCANRRRAPVMIQRRSARSWAIVNYEPEDGPWRDTPPTFGEVNVEAPNWDAVIFDEAVLEPGHEGSLIRIFHPDHNTRTSLGGDNAYTDVWRVQGIKGERQDDRVYSYSIIGTGATGTLRFERSIAGEDGDYNETARDDQDSTTFLTLPANLANTVNGVDEDANLLAFHRIGFGADDHGSGSVSVDVQKQGFGGYGIARLDAVSSNGLEADLLILTPLNNFNTTDSWLLGAWSDAYEWPTSVALFDNRLWWGGIDRVWASAAGNYFSFDDLDVSDAASFYRLLGSGGQSNQAQWLLSLQRLLVGTSGSELSLRSSAVGDVLTPENATVRTASSYGSSYVAPARLDSKGVFIHRDGVTSMLLDFQSGQDYATGKLTEYNDSILVPGCISLGVARQPETYIYHVRSDGQMAILMLDEDSEANLRPAWTRFVTAGEIEDVAVLPADDEDATYLSVKRPLPPPEGLPQETNADILMGADSEGVAMDFTDGSVTVRSYLDPDRYAYRGTNTRDTDIRQLQRSDFGIAPGPDRYFISWGNYVSTETWPVFCRQADGVLRLQQHNFVVSSEKFRVLERSTAPFSLDDQATNPYIVYITPDDPFNGGNDIQEPSMQGEDNVVTSPRGDMTGAKVWATSTGGASAQHMYMLIHLGSSQGPFDPGEPVEAYYWNNPETWISLSLKPAEFDRMEFFIACRNSDNVNNWYDTNYPEVVGSNFDESSSYIAYRCDATNGTITLVEETHDASETAFVTDTFVEPQEDGWYRFHFKTSMTADGYYGWKLLNAAGDRAYAGDNSSGIYTWGWQEKMVGTDDDFCYLKTETEFSVFPDFPSQATVLLPYEWDAEGNPQGILCYDYEFDNTNETYQKWGAVSHYDPVLQGGAPEVASNWRADLDGGSSTSTDGVLGPDRYTPAGVWTDDDTGVSSGYCGINLVRNTYTGYCNGSIFVRYTGSCRYFTISQVNQSPAPDEWHSVTWDLETMTVTEEFTSAGGSLTELQVRTEPYIDGWYRISTSCRSSGSFGRVRFAMSTIPNPGSQTNGVDSTTGTDNTVQVWYPAGQAANSFNTAIPGPPRPRNRDSESWGGAMYHLLPLGDNASQTFDYVGENRPEVPFDLDCYRLEQTINVIDARTDVDGFEPDFVDGDGVNYGWPTEYISNIFPTLFGYIHNYVDNDPNLDGFPRRSGFILTPEADISAIVQQAWSYQIAGIYFRNAPGTAVVFGADTTVVVNQYKDIAAATSVADPYDPDFVYTGIPQTGIEYVKDGEQVGVALGSANFQSRPDSDGGPTWWPLQRDTDNRGTYYLKQLKITSRCLPDEPRFIERVNKHTEAEGGTINKMGDAGGYFPGPVSSVQVEGLAGRTDIVGWGTRVSDGLTVPLTGLGSDGDGLISLGEAYTDVFVGIVYTGRYKSGKLAYGAGGGTSLEQPKRVSEFGVLLTKTHRDAVKFGEDFDRMRSMPTIYKGARVPANTIYLDYDDTSFAFPGSWDTDSRLCLRMQAPLPATLTGLVISVEANPRGGRS